MGIFMATAMLVYWRVNWCFIWSERLRFATHLLVLKIIFGTCTHDERNPSCLMANRSKKVYIVSVSFFFSKGHGIATCCKIEDASPSSKSFSGIFQAALVLQVWMGFSFPISCCLWLLWSFPCVSAFACPCSQHHNDVKRKESPCACQLWAKSQSRQS